jgi:hypothetical protein
MRNPDLPSCESRLEDRKPPLSRLVGRYRALGETLAAGLLLGFADSNHAGNQGFVLPAYLGAGVLIGLRHAGRSFPCWPLLGVSLYAVHVVAIACGREPPYVEENYRFAEQCLWVIIPSGLGIMAGAGGRVALSYFGWFHREAGPPVRFLPKTTREVIVAVACIGVGLGCLKQMMFPPTIYAAGYDESRFHAIHEGMTTDQVETALGPPLQRRASPDGRETWEYSSQYTYTSDYEIRRIMFGGGLVQGIVSAHWFD